MKNLNQRYEVVKLIGKDRAGEVYKALDTVLNRHVAIRYFTKHEIEDIQRDKAWQDQFFSLVGEFSQINNPHLVKLVDGGIEEDVPFLISLFIKGDRLEGLLLKEEFEIVDAYDLARQALEALIMAENKGFYHHAISPASVIATKKEQGGYHFTLTDVGLNELLPLVYGEQKAMEMLLNPTIFAPEIYENKPAGGKTSQYLLAQLLYWVLANEETLECLTAEEAYHKHREGKLLPATLQRLDMPMDLSNWLNQALQIDTELRFPTLQDALNALPPTPLRFITKKINKPPTPIRPEDLGSTAQAMPKIKHAYRRKRRKSSKKSTNSDPSANSE